MTHSLPCNTARDSEFAKSTEPSLPCQIQQHHLDRQHSSPSHSTSAKRYTATSSNSPNQYTYSKTADPTPPSQSHHSPLRARALETGPRSCAQTARSTPKPAKSSTPRTSL
ncbi:hypothetical protein BJY00DRAFT_293767 [Aspergillus carlsbadensis]|nr:hypothetical protein BJY00DRAFT_293767 [Aspergillus carlsbadensis]